MITVTDFIFLGSKITANGDCSREIKRPLLLGRKIMKSQNDRILKEELPRWVSAQYATRDQWTNNSRQYEETEPKQKQYPAVDVTGNRSKI